MHILETFDRNFQSFSQVVLRAMLYFRGLADHTRFWFGVD